MITNKTNMTVKFKWFNRKHKSIHIYRKNSETIIRYWGWFKFDYVTIYNSNKQD